jgi:hypothetical protein
VLFEYYESCPTLLALKEVSKICNE